MPYKVNEAALEQCQELLSKVCSCGCKGTGRIREGELNTTPDKMALLQNWEKELQREIQEVRGRMEDLEKEK